MSFMQRYIAYLKDNPEGYWFKAKRFGWGWTPATWQGWLVLMIGIGIALLGVYVGEHDDAPGAALLGVVAALVLVFYVGYKKGERPHWYWGLPPEQENGDGDTDLR